MTETPILHRTYQVELERVDDRVVEGMCVPYDVVANVNDGVGVYREKFVRGAFRGQLSAPNRLELRWEHGDDLLSKVGRGVRLEERDDGLHGVFQAFATAVGDQALAMIDSSDSSYGLSVGFAPSGKPRTSPDGVVIRDRCRLVEVSLVGQPAYAGAVVTARRSRSDFELPPEPVDEQLERLRAVGITVD